MNNLFNFGLLTGFTVIMALISDYFIAPALMMLVNREGTLPKGQITSPILTFPHHCAHVKRKV